MSLAKLIARAIEIGWAPAPAAELLAEAFDLGIEKASAVYADKSADVRRGPLESTASQDYKTREMLRKRAKRAADKAAKLSAPASAPSADKTLSDSVVLTSLLPEKVSPKSKKDSAVRARGTRLAPGTPLSAEHRALILAEGIHDPEKLWAEFVDYWSDIPGQRGVKVSWTGTIRNRCRDVIKWGQNNGHGNSNNRAGGAPGPAQSGSAAIFAGVAEASDRRARQRSAAGQQRQTPDDGGPAAKPDLEFFGTPDRRSPH